MACMAALPWKNSWAPALSSIALADSLTHLWSRQLLDVAEGLLPLGRGELAGAAQDGRVGVLAHDPGRLVGEPVAGGPQVLVAGRDRDDALGIERVTRGEELLPRRRGRDAVVGKELLVVPEHVGHVGGVGDHAGLAVQRVRPQDGVVPDARQRAGLELLRDVGREAVLDALLEAGTGPFEVDVRGVLAIEQPREADRLVQVVLLVVDLHLGLGMGGHVLLGDIVPDTDLRLAGRAHGDAQDVVVLRRAAATAACDRQHRHRGERDQPLAVVHALSPPRSSSSIRPGLTWVPVRSARVMSSASPNTRTRARRNRAR